MSHLAALNAPMQFPSHSGVEQLPPTLVSVQQPVARRTSILVVDHHPVVQHGVRVFLDGEPRFTVVATAETGAGAITQARHARPDVALLEPWLPDMLLGELVERLRASSPNTRLIAFASQVTPTLRDEVGWLGIQGLLGKGAAAEDVAAMVARVAAGETVTPPPSDSFLRQAADKLHCAVLTAREHEILRLAARGASNSEIASEIYLAPTTVKSYLQSALAKLGARNRVEAVYKLGAVGLL
jgi:two-component system nitrate/nitrite response regulator NarL